MQFLPKPCFTPHPGRRGILITQHHPNRRSTLASPLCIAALRPPFPQRSSETGRDSKAAAAWDPVAGSREPHLHRIHRIGSGMIPSKGAGLGYTVRNPCPPYRKAAGIRGINMSLPRLGHHWRKQFKLLQSSLYIGHQGLCLKW